MDVWRWVHLGVLLVPVAIFTAFNIAGTDPSPHLAGALSALTTGAALATGIRKRPAPARKRRANETRNPAPKPERLAPARVAENEHRVP